MAHISVLKEEVINFLAPKENENFIDATAGGGGHTLEILKRNGPNGRILCLDLDQEALECVREKITAENPEYLERLILVESNFADLEKIIREKNFENISGILADLGFSSMQLEGSGRGFSFLKNEKLNMRFSKSADLTAAKIVNEWPPEKLEKIFKEYGEEPFARQISQTIARERKIKPISMTGELADIIARVIPKKFQPGRIHFATKTFQALRIAVNDELANLEKFLPQAIAALKKEGRLVVISFQSLEDRIVKNFFKEASKKGETETLTKKPVRPAFEEIKNNPRSRSARLRAILKK